MSEQRTRFNFSNDEMSLLQRLVGVEAKRLKDVIKAHPELDTKAVNDALLNARSLHLYLTEGERFYLTKAEI